MAKPSLDHAGIRVGDLDRSRQFYEGLLGLEVAPRPDFGLPGIWYTLGASQLHLIQNQPSDATIDPTAPHFAIVVEDLESVRDKLTKAGLEMLAVGSDVFWVKDPDGNTVELRTANAFR